MSATAFNLKNKPALRAMEWTAGTHCQGSQLTSGGRASTPSASAPIQLHLQHLIIPGSGNQDLALQSKDPVWHRVHEGVVLHFDLLKRQGIKPVWEVFQLVVLNKEVHQVLDLAKTLWKLLQAVIPKPQLPAHRALHQIQSRCTQQCQRRCTCADTLQVRTHAPASTSACPCNVQEARKVCRKALINRNCMQTAHLREERLPNASGRDSSLLSNSHSSVSLLIRQNSSGKLTSWFVNSASSVRLFRLPIPGGNSVSLLRCQVDACRLAIAATSSGTLVNSLMCKATRISLGHLQNILCTGTSFRPVDDVGTTCTAKEEQLTMHGQHKTASSRGNTALGQAGTQ